MCRFISVFLFSFLTACASTVSYEEYALAEVAVGAAEKARARQLSPNDLLKAQSYLRRAQMAFVKKDYDKARSLFNKSKKKAESAETLSYIKRSRQGGVLY